MRGLCLIHVARIKDRQLTVMSPSCVRKLKAVNMMNLRIHSLETGLWWEQIQQSYRENMPHDKDLTLQSAISLCKSAETTRRQMKVLQEKGGALHGGTEPVNVIKRDRKRITQNKRYVAPPW